MPFAKMTVYVAKAINKQAIQDSIRGCGAKLTWTLPEPQGIVTWNMCPDASSRHKANVMVTTDPGNPGLALKYQAFLHGGL